MKKIIGLMALAIILVGCTPGGSEESSSTSGNTYNVEAGGDVSINDTTVSDGGTYVNNGDGTITFAQGDGDIFVNEDGVEEEIPSEPSGVFSTSYTQDECLANGYFFCTITQECVDVATRDGSCTSE